MRRRGTEPRAEQKPLDLSNRENYKPKIQIIYTNRSNPIHAFPWSFVQSGFQSPKFPVTKAVWRMTYKRIQRDGMIKYSPKRELDWLIEVWILPPMVCRATSMERRAPIAVQSKALMLMPRTENQLPSSTYWKPREMMEWKAHSCY